ncbi:MAG: T9SS type A sorting domain-containing protein [Ignavibacteria bacterium]
MKVTITDTVTYSGKQYYTYTSQLLLISGTCSFSPFMFPFYVGNYNTIRIDSVSGKIFYYNPSTGCNGETLLDSLSCRLSDTVKVNCVPSPYYYICVDTTIRKKFDSFQTIWSPGRLKREYEYQVGLYDNYYYSNQSGLQGTSQQTLIGRVVNGTVYGDTAMPFVVGANQTSSEIPSKLELSQNYPNPFNPTTKIKFQIPLSRGVSEGRGVLTQLTIYDALGKEVQTLVNSELQPGSYETDWDASAYPSGVYYYKLESGSFTETRKMVLIK